MNNISEEEIVVRDIFRKQVLGMQGLQRRMDKKTCAKWLKDRKKHYSEMMKEFWKERKKKQQRKKN